MKAVRFTVVLAAVGLLLSGSAAAQKPVDERVFQGLAGPVAPGTHILVPSFALDDGSVISLDVAPVEVFAPGAEIVVHGPLGESRAPVPSDRWFAGAVAGDPNSVVVLALGKSVRGYIATGGKVAVLGPGGKPYDAAPSGSVLVRTFSAELDAPDALRFFKCDTDVLPTPPDALAPPTSSNAPLSSTMYYAGIAVETDYELYAKFNSVANLTNYVGDLFAGISYVYQRDVIVTMQVNYLSIWTTAADPWTTTSSSAALSEFLNYWNANRTAVPRITAHMLSGRSLGGGIAYLNALCSSSYGYGLTGNLSGTSPQPPYATPFWDFFAVSHELGHNFGSVHTHCYSPPVDQCYNAEGGCYSGPTSVPPQKGTIMSYCHLWGWSAVKVFLGVNGEPSQVVKTTIRTFVEGRSSCFGTVPGPTVTGISPPAGPPAGGTSVTISGSGFQAGAAVKVGGTAATGVSVVNGSTITATTPAHALGAVDVTVTNPGNQGYTLVGGYTYLCTTATPTAGNGGPYCAGATISLTTPTVSGATYAWTGPAGFTSTLQNPTIPGAGVPNSGTYSVVVTTSGCLPSSPGTTFVTVNPVPSPSITAPASALPGTTGLTASVPLRSGDTYAWGITNGTITAGATTNQITFTAGASDKTVLSVVETTTATGCASATTTADVYISGEPEGLVEDAHASAGTSSDVNGILEPGETVLVNASWKNIGASPLPLTGTASAFTGPAGATYTLFDTAANYGTIAPGATADSYSAGGPSYRLFVSDPASRPATHWDATFLETLSTGVEKTWTLHVGKSFTDVPSTDVSYPFVETIFHRGITVGYGPGIFAPATIVSRWQMAVFLSRSLGGPAVAPPASGSVPGVGPYACAVGGPSLFTDVPPTDVACPHIHDIYAQGVTIGCAPGLFCPNDPTPRWQMAVFLTRSLLGAGVPPPVSGSVPGVGSYNCTAGGNSLFTDVPKTDVACPFIHYIYSRAITTGCAPGLFCPNDPTPRWQMAIFLVRTFSLPLLY